MKRTISTITLAIITAAAVYGQDITVHATNRPAEKVFAEIMRQSGKNFVYSSSLLKGLTVSVDATGKPLPEVLDSMFAGTDISYKIRGKNITLFRKETPRSQKVTLSGFVREEGSGESLPGAVVRNSSGNETTTSNSMGFYSLTVPAGSPVNITVSYPGFKNYTSGNIGVNADRNINVTLRQDPEMLNEVVVHGSKNRTLAMESTGVGALNLNNSVIASTPVIFGESDVIKTIQLEPGISAGVEGMAGMYVHGGNSDENLYMLDNIPLYQVNHFAGLFSAFNTEALKNVDFYKSTFPARYDGRLSSYMDVHTKDGSMTEHHGSARLGLTSGAFNIDGPIWKEHTSYAFAIRRSWYDVLSIPALAIVNKYSTDEKDSFGYAFTDINAKINHRFSDRSRLYAMFYYGDDYLKVSQLFDTESPTGYYDETKNNLRWGNIVASAGWNYVLSPKLFGEVTAAYTRYQSRLTHSYETGDKVDDKVTDFSIDRLRYDNNINDWIFKADFDWRPTSSHTIDFGASYTRHSFLPSRTRRTLTTESFESEVSDDTKAYRANEFSIYAGDDWTPSDNLRINFGGHFSLFNISGKTHAHFSPRVSARWTPAPGWAVKGGYSHTVQYVHQLMQSSISLPTDQWVPVVGNQKPQTADKISAGVYCSLLDGYTFSVEGYWKWMHNLLEYRDEYYLMPPETIWSDKMTGGKGTAKGIDFKVSKEFGKFSGHISYSLLWADREYADRNRSKKYPARFDNRHKINVLVNWKINKKWEMSASWTGMSGNRFTLATQCWSDPYLAPWHYDMLLATDINNFRLPFYHRMDLSFKRNTRRGYWNFSLYNAYCNMNTIAVIRDYRDTDYYNPYDDSLVPVFKKVKLLPIIPSVSYTWIF